MGTRIARVEGCELATVFAWQLFRRVLDLLDSPPNHRRNPVNKPRTVTNTNRQEMSNHTFVTIIYELFTVP
jgi:hypothetical protein